MDRRQELLVLVLAGAAGVGLAALAGVVGMVVPLAVAAAAVFVGVAVRPVAAAYIYLAALPFVTGMPRGTGIPTLRPNEALQGFLLAAVLAGLYVRFVQGERVGITLTRTDRALLAMAALASLWPLAWMLVRSAVPGPDDLMATVPLWRLAALYVTYRVVVREPQQVRRCMWILVSGATTLAVIAALQSLDLIVLPSLWASDDPSSGTGRGAGTLSSAIAVGDYVACSVAVVLAWILRSKSPSPLLYGAGAVLMLGGLGSGQFSGWIALVVVIALVARHEGQLARLIVRAVPVAVLGLVLTWPVVGLRLAGFTSSFGVPRSWLGRVDNLSNFYLPALGGLRWVLGVGPNSVLQAPETWRDVIYLESGLLWFLWVGGVPLLVAGLWFFRVAIRQTRAVARCRTDDVGVLSLATWAALWAIALLTIIDMHLTLRGAADLLFILLGLSSIGATAGTPVHAEVAPTVVALRTAVD